MGWLVSQQLLSVACVGLLLAYFATKFKTDIILSGIALNLMASGGTVFLLYVVAKDKGVSSSLNSKVLPKIDIPLLEQIPILGDIFSGHNVLTYVAFIAVISCSISYIRRHWITD